MTSLKFSDIGKSSSDLLNKDFPHGFVRIEGRSSEVTNQNVSSKLNVLGVRDNTTGSLIGELKNTVTMSILRPVKTSPSAPLILESTTTIGSIGSVIQHLELKDPLTKGLTVSAVGTISQIGTPQIKFGIDYDRCIAKNAYWKSSSVMDIFKGPSFVHDSTLKIGDLVIGAQAGYDSVKSMPDIYSAAIGIDLAASKLSLHTFNAGNSFTASFYQKFSSGVEAAYKMSWNRKSTSSLGMEIVSKFPIDPASSLKAKLDNLGKLGLSYTTQFNPKVSLTLSGTFETLKMEENGHHVGCSFLVDI